MKVYAMSDIHGFLHEFEDALSCVDLSGDNMLILLGDYIHGPDSYGVLDRIIGLQNKYGPEKVVALLGNHEGMALNGSWPICADRYSFANENYDDKKENSYLGWMSNLPLYYQVGNAIFVHAGIDEETAEDGYWEWGTDEQTFTNKFPADTGKIENFDMKIVAGHVGTNILSGNPHYHDIFFDGGSHYYIDGTVQESGEIPVIMYDTEKDSFHRVTNYGVWAILPYGEEN